MKTSSIYTEGLHLQVAVGMLDSGDKERHELSQAGGCVSTSSWSIINARLGVLDLEIWRF